MLRCRLAGSASTHDNFYNDGFVNITETPKEKVCLLRAADNPRISKSIGLGRATIRDSPGAGKYRRLSGLRWLLAFLLRGVFQMSGLSLRFANVGVLAVVGRLLGGVAGLG